MDRLASHVAGVTTSAPVIVALTAAVLACVSCGLACGGQERRVATKAHSAGASSAALFTVPRGTPVRRWELTPGRRAPFGDYDADELKGGRVDGDDDDNTTGPLDSDGDRDATGGAYFDADDKGAGIPDSPAGPRDARAIEALVKRYFAAAVSTNGRQACALMLPTLAKGLPLDPGVLPYARAKTCAATMDKFLHANHRQLATEAKALEGVHPRVSGDRGWVLLSFRRIATRGFPLRRHDGAWKMSVTIADQDLP